MLRSGKRLPQAEHAKTARKGKAQSLARMKRDGLIRRQPDPGDRRSSLVVLTDAVSQRPPTGRQGLCDGNAEMTRGLSETEVPTLVGLLRRALDNVPVLADIIHNQTFTPTIQAQTVAPTEDAPKPGSSSMITPKASSCAGPLSGGYVPFRTSNIETFVNR